MLVRSRKQLADVVARDPLGKVAKNPSHYLVTFLRSKPPAKVVRELAAEDVAPEQFVIEGREVYAWHPDGVQSKLNKLLAQRLDVTSTARNWNTVTKLLELAPSEEGARRTAPPARARRPAAWSARTPRAAAPRSARRRPRRS